MAALLSLTDSPASTIQIADTGTALTVQNADTATLAAADTASATITLGDLP